MKFGKHCRPNSSPMSNNNLCPHPPPKKELPNGLSRAILNGDGIFEPDE